MTRDDVGDDGAGGDRRAAGQDEDSVDELVEPSVDLRTAQEKEAVSNSEDCVGTADTAGEELDELVEPATDIRTVQEQEAADVAADAGADEGDQEDEEGECDE